MPLWGKGSSDKPKYLISGAPNHDPEDCFATEEGWILRHYKGHDKNTAPYWDEVLVAINGIDLGGGGGGGSIDTSVRVIVGSLDDTNGSNSGAVYSYLLDGSGEVKIIASDSGANKGFSRQSVAVGGGKIVVASNGDGNDPTQLVYVYDLDGTNELTFSSSDLVSSDAYATAVAVGNDKILTSSPEKDSLTGAIYLTDLDGTNELKITASDGSTGDLFGTAIAVGNNKIVSGAKREATNGTQAGAVYVYDLDGTNEIKIIGSDTDAYDQFGEAVAIGENKIVVGASKFTFPTSNAEIGAAYIYDLDGTNEVILSPSSGSPDLTSKYGAAVAIGNGKVAVSAIQSDAAANNHGAVYLYDLDGTNEILITASDAEASDSFGRQIAIAGNKLIVGSPQDQDQGGLTGSIYIYDLDGTNEQKILSSDAVSGQSFGISIAAAVATT